MDRALSGRIPAVLLSIAAGSAAFAACGAPASVARHSASGSVPAESAPHTEPTGSSTTTTPTTTTTTTTMAPSPVTVVQPVPDAAVAMAPEVTGGEAVRAVVELSSPVDRIVFIGDSIQADLREIGGRPTNIVRALAVNLVATPGLEHMRVDNEAVPGLAIKYSTSPLARAPFHTVGGLVDYLFGHGSGSSSDLVILAASAIDIGTEFDTAIEDLAPELVAELQRIVAVIEGTGAQVVIVPSLGVNDQLYGELKLFVSKLDGGDPDLTVYDMSARVGFFNAALASSDLPLLFADFALMDLDADGAVDIEFFENYDLDGWPDDGVHPNKAGETEYVLQILPPLIEALLAAQAS